MNAQVEIGSWDAFETPGMERLVDAGSTERTDVVRRRPR